jgi:hypothetical protein
MALAPLGLGMGCWPLPDNLMSSHSPTAIGDSARMLAHQFVRPSLSTREPKGCSFGLLMGCVNVSEAQCVKPSVNPRCPLQAVAARRR